MPSPSSASSDPTGSPARLRPAGQPPAARSARPALPPADGLAPGGLHLHPAPAAAPASPTTTRHPPTLPGVRRRRAAVAMHAISFLYQNNIKMMVFRYWSGEFIAPATVGDLGSTLLIRRGRIRPDRGPGPAMPRTQPTPTPLDRLRRRRARAAQIRRRRSMACSSVAPRKRSAPGGLPPPPLDPHRSALASQVQARRPQPSRPAAAGLHAAHHRRRSTVGALRSASPVRPAVRRAPGARLAHAPVCHRPAH